MRFLFINLKDFSCIVFLKCLLLYIYVEFKVRMMSDLAKTRVSNICCYWINQVPQRPPVKLMCWYLPLHLEYSAIKQCQ